MLPLDQAAAFIQFAALSLGQDLLARPLLLLLTLLAGAVTFLLWRLLSSPSRPPPLSSPLAPALLLLLLPAALLHHHHLSARLAASQHAVLASQRTLETGRLDRDQLLQRVAGPGPANPLDGCLHVFIDLGSNRGLQIRKLYEPHLFPLAPVLPLYERYFGPPDRRNLQEICTVGFEPNKRHTEHLLELAANYSTCGIRVVMHTETGVGDRDTVGSFASDLTFQDLSLVHDMGAKFLARDQSLESLRMTHDLGGSQLTEVRMMRVATYITEVVATRQLPLSAQVHRPRVVVKCDIEGGELEVVTDMVLTGAMGVVDNLHMEWHGVHGPGITRKGREPEMIDRLAEAVTGLGRVSRQLGREDGFTVEELDDETYGGLVVYALFGDYSGLPTPTC